MAVISDLDEMVAAIGTVSPVGRRTTVGITGAPGAGKSTLAAALVDRIGATAVLLPMDGFHLPQQRLVELGRRQRMGAPDTFDVDGFLDVLGRVRDSRDEVLAPDFDRTVEEPVPNGIRVGAEHALAVVEGNYLLLDSGRWEEAAALLDVSFFLDVPRDIRLRRLIDRHVRFGKTPEAAAAWVLGSDERNAELIATTAHRASHRFVLT